MMPVMSRLVGPAAGGASSSVTVSANAPLAVAFRHAVEPEGHVAVALEVLVVDGLDRDRLGGPVVGASGEGERA